MFQVSLVLWGIAPLIRVHARRFLRSSPPINLAVRDRGLSWRKVAKKGCLNMTVGYRPFLRDG